MIVADMMVNDNAGVDDEIDHFPSLRVLNVSYNFFASESSLIPLVDCCTTLKWLDVRGNLFNVPRLHTPNRADGTFITLSSCTTNIS